LRAQDPYMDWRGEMRTGTGSVCLQSGSSCCCSSCRHAQISNRNRVFYLLAVSSLLRGKISLLVYRTGQQKPLSSCNLHLFDLKRRWREIFNRSLQSVLDVQIRISKYSYFLFWLNSGCNWRIRRIHQDFLIINDDFKG
jgi:hypothetical protein